MTHSLVVVDGHGKIPARKYNFWEPETKEEGYHLYIQNLKHYLSNGVHVANVDMSSFWHPLQGTNHNDSRSYSMVKLFHGIEGGVKTKC